VPRSLAQLRGSGLACATAPSSARRMMPLCMQAEPGTAPLVKAIAGLFPHGSVSFHKSFIRLHKICLYLGALAIVCSL